MSTTTVDCNSTKEVTQTVTQSPPSKKRRLNNPVDSSQPHSDNLTPILPTATAENRSSTSPLPLHTSTPQREDQPRVQGPRSSNQNDSSKTCFPTNQLKELELSSFTKHDHFGDKLANWSLSPDKPILIVGDSNLSRLPLIANKSNPSRFLSYPIHILQNHTPISESVEAVILSFGLNDKDNCSLFQFRQQLNQLFDAAITKFPWAEVFVPLINFSPSMLPRFKKNIAMLNQVLHDSGRSIPLIPDEQFSMVQAGIHWTPETATAIWGHWEHFLEQDPWVPHLR